MPPTLRAKIRASELAYYITAGRFGGFDLRQNFSSARNGLGKFFLETLFMQNLSLHEALAGAKGVFVVFLRGVFGAPKRFTE